MAVIDISPDTHFIEAMMNQGMEAFKAFAELIDNSFDAEASMIKIDWNATEIKVHDNGVGVADLSACAKLGSHKNEGRKAVGRYGIGLKESIASLGRAYTIETIRNHMRSYLYVDFEKIKSAKKWVAELSEPERVKETISGTRITITNLTKSRRKTPELMANLGAIFYPALREGRKIMINGVEVEAPLELKLSEKVSGSGEHNGRAYRWFAGIAGKDYKGYGGWDIVLNHRVLKSACTEGIPSSYLTSKFFGCIELLEEIDGVRWSPRKHKDGVDDAYEICTEIFPFIKHILEKCSKELAISIDADIATDVTDAIGGRLHVLAKEFRGAISMSGNGRIKPKDSGSKRTKVEETQEGTSELEQKRKNQSFSIIPDPDSTMFVNVIGSSTSNTVIIGTKNPFWQKEDFTKYDVMLAVASCALVTQAMTLDGDKQPVLFIINKEEGTLARKAFSALDSMISGLPKPRKK